MCRTCSFADYNGKRWKLEAAEKIAAMVDWPRRRLDVAPITIFRETTG